MFHIAYQCIYELTYVNRQESSLFPKARCYNTQHPRNEWEISIQSGRKSEEKKDIGYFCIEQVQSIFFIEGAISKGGPLQRLKKMNLGIWFLRYIESLHFACFNYTQKL